MTLLNGSLGGGSGGGGANSTPVVVIGNYIIQRSDRVLLVDASLGPVALTFAPVAANNGQQVQVLKTDATNNAVTVSDGAVIRGGLVQPAVGANCQTMLITSTGAALLVS